MQRKPQLCCKTVHTEAYSSKHYNFGECFIADLGPFSGTSELAAEELDTMKEPKEGNDYNYN